MQKRAGWWNKTKYPTHEYRRRQVKEDVKRFVGWKALAGLIRKAEGYQADRTKALIAVAFTTGGRIMEVMQLQSSNFTVEKDTGELVVKNMAVLKRYKKTGQWLEYVDEKPDNELARLYRWDEDKEQWVRNRYETKFQEETRDFSIPIEEPFTPLILDRIEQFDGYLFPGYKHKHLSYQRVYQIITDLGIYPHWLRAQRASCLVSFYRMSMDKMMEWMAWEELSTARHYAKHGVRSLVSQMKGRTYPVAPLIA